MAEERALDLEARVHSLEESLEALRGENARLDAEIIAIHERMERMDASLDADSKTQFVFPDKGQWSEGKDDSWSQTESAVEERTARLVEDSGGEVHYVAHPEREERAVLALPQETVEGETPLIVALHGFGGDSAALITYVPMHERVNTDGFALLLPNGMINAEGSRSWNPTDDAFTKNSGAAPQDDIAYLRELTAEARNVMDFGPMYFFGYSNGGFMSYHIACKGLPGLRAVASLSGTSYVEDSVCEGAPPVSALHIHGTADEVILFEGDGSEPVSGDAGESAFYLGARDMVERWGRIAGCDLPQDMAPNATLDLDQYVSGAETQAFRLESGCAEGVDVQLWESVGSSHAPGYGSTFVDSLLEWLLAQG